ncbi:MAG: triose-phosphate isomerase [Acidimicrobiales bacterium]
MPDRKPLVSGNWKMNKNHFEAIQATQKLSYRLRPEDYRRADVSIHPPFTDLRSVQTVLESDQIPVSLGAQDCHGEDAGAFTGEVSPVMLAKLNVAYVIVGHSERRSGVNGEGGESDKVVRTKLGAVLRHGMIPILCVGETAEERDRGMTGDKVAGQVGTGLDGLTGTEVAGLVVAYEPIWAIGTGRTATPQDAQEVCGQIRALVASHFGAQAGLGVRIQYGGSVKADTMADLMAQPDIDGALVGGASLDPDEFARIVQFA